MRASKRAKFNPIPGAPCPLSLEALVNLKIYHKMGAIEGIPYGWQQEPTGKLPEAVKAYYNERTGAGTITEEQLRLMALYLVYFINAPVWEANLTATGDMLQELYALRERAEWLASAESISRWISEAMDLGLDPF